MTALNIHPGEKPQSSRRPPRRRVRMGGDVHLGPLAVSVATLLAIAWLVSFQHQHSSLYDNVPHPDPPAAAAAAQR
jgi:hypothetical protein